jgi:hypothetical protein
VRPGAVNAAIQWFISGLMLGIILTAAAACQPEPEPPPAAPTEVVYAKGTP